MTGLASRTREADLERKFSKFGEVVKAHLVCDPRTGDSRGFAFVTMGSDTEAQDAMEGGNRTELDGRIISVEKNIEFHTTTTTTNQHLKNIINKHNNNNNNKSANANNKSYNPRRQRADDGHQVSKLQANSNSSSSRNNNNNNKQRIATQI